MQIIYAMNVQILQETVMYNVKCKQIWLFFSINLFCLCVFPSRNDCKYICFVYVTRFDKEFKKSTSDFCYTKAVYSPRKADTVYARDLNDNRILRDDEDTDLKHMKGYGMSSIQNMIMICTKHAVMSLQI